MKKLHLYQSADSNPREWDNLGKMICFHSRYDLGDKHEYTTDDFDGWEDMQNKLIRQNDLAIILPLYLYDHSGITISTTPFGCKWDSGQVGYVIVTRAELRENFMVKRLSAKLIEQGKEIIVSEIKTYDQYLRGDVFGFRVEDENGNTLDSCGGFYGTDWEENGILEYINFEEYGWTKEEAISMLEAAELEVEY